MKSSSCDAAVRELHGRMMVADVHERRRILTELPLSDGPLPERLSHEDLKALAREPLASIGAHGWSHRMLAELPIDVLRQEVMGSIRTLAEVTGTATRSFAYPFGGATTSELLRLLRRAGIRVACTVDPAPITVDSDPLFLPRLEVGDWDEHQFQETLRSVFNG